jgi:hypothetical protein
MKAKESPQIKKMRQKVKAHMAEEDKLITPTAIEQEVKSIHHWLERHADERIDLVDKNIAMFDANKHPKPVSDAYVKGLLHKLLKENKSAKKSSQTLRGRIKKQG